MGDEKWAKMYWQVRSIPYADVLCGAWRGLGGRAAGGFLPDVSCRWFSQFKHPSLIE